MSLNPKLIGVYGSFHHSALFDIDIFYISYLLSLNLFWGFSYTLFDMDGHQVPQRLVKEVGDIFKKILKEVSIFQLNCGMED